MAATKKVNYTDEQTADLIQRYDNGNGQSVKQIAEELGRASRSVISKLVREGVYVTPEPKAKAKREEGPTKKEMLNTLESLVTFPVEGLMGATKEAIGFLIAAFSQDEVEASEDEDEADAA